MSGLYNTVFGENSQADALLKMLGLTRGDFGRYRDCYLESGGDTIVVYTRCGGGNRDDYQSVFDEMAKHTSYSRDWDDDFDSTYAYFEFHTPEKYRELTKAMESDEEPKRVGDKFQELIASLSQ